MCILYEKQLLFNITTMLHETSRAWQVHKICLISMRGFEKLETITFNRDQYDDDLIKEFLLFRINFVIIIARAVASGFVLGC